jgi:dipeptidyl aminopeptidase/acylaminoacyl peptidase
MTQNGSRVIALIVALGMFGLTAGAGEYTVTNDVAFTARVDGTTQRYVELRPEGFEPAKETHLVLALHGHGSDRWQYVREARSECQGARDVAAKYGMIFVSPDYRATTSWMGPLAEADIVQMIGDLRAKYNIGKVLLVGASMGGSSVLTFAALHPGLVAGVSSQNGTANHLEYEKFQDAIQASFGGTKAAIPLEYKKRSAEYWPEAFTMPLAITCSGKDTYVPPDSVLRLASILQKLGRPVLLLHRPERGHETDYADTTAALEFVVTHALGLAPPPPAAAAAN